MIKLGTQVRWDLYGDGIGFVSAVTPYEVRNVVGINPSAPDAANDCYVDILFLNGHRSTRVPECIVRGVQWKLFEHVIAKPDYLAKLEQAEQDKEKADAVQKSKEDQAFAEQVEMMPSKYPYLKPVSGKHAPYKEKAANVRAMLKFNFPDTKFRVTKDRYDSVNIEWLDGPTKSEIKELMSNFKASSYDGMQECTNFHTSPFNVVFGGMNSDLIRRYSDEAIQQAIDDAAVYFNATDDKPTIEEFRKGQTSLKSPISNFGGEYTASWAHIIFAYLEHQEV